MEGRWWGHSTHLKQSGVCYKSLMEPWDNWARRKQMRKTTAFQKLGRHEAEEQRTIEGSSQGLRRSLPPKSGSGPGLVQNTAFRSTGWWLGRVHPCESSQLENVPSFLLRNVRSTRGRRELVCFTKQSHSNSSQYLIHVLSMPDYSTVTEFHYWMG